MERYSIDFAELIKDWLNCLWCAVCVIHGSMDTWWGRDFVSGTSFMLNNKSKCRQLPEQLFYNLVAMIP